jgi:hypothetical protein
MIGYLHNVIAEVSGPLDLRLPGSGRAAAEQGDAEAEGMKSHDSSQEPVLGDSADLVWIRLPGKPCERISQMTARAAMLAGSG